MSVNKNFVIKNGLEVDNSLIFADATTDRVGIGSTIPSAKLDVNGPLEADDVNISGVTSIAGDFNVGSSGTTFHVDTTKGLAGVGTNAPDFLLHVYGPASTGTTALYVRGDARITGDLILDDLNLDSATFNFLNVSGMSTLADVRVTGDANIAGITTLNDVIASDLNVSGITTVSDLLAADLNVSGITTLKATDINSTLSVSGFTTVSDVIAKNITALSVGSTNLNVTGVATFNTMSVLGVAVTNLTVSGVGTINTVESVSVGTTNLTVSGVGTINTVEAVSVGTTNLTVTGVGTINTVEAVTIGSTNLNVSGVGTIPTIQSTTVNTTNLIATGIVTASSEEIYTEFDITNNGVGAYQFAMTGIGFTANTDNPDLYLERGRNYRFNVNASGHPLWLKTAPETGVGFTFNNGVTNNGAAVGVVTFKVPFNSPNTLYYQCQNHAAMNGHVYVLDAGIGTDVSINTSGIITASKFVGVGSELTDLNIGISSANDSTGTEEFIGTGVTNLVFHSTTGTGLTVTGVTNGKADVFISPGASIGLVIALSG